MTDIPVATTVTAQRDGRPVARLPNRELIRMSLYWLGLSSIFAGLTAIMTGRLQFTDLADKATAGRAPFPLSITRGGHPNFSPTTHRPQPGHTNSPGGAPEAAQ